MPRPRLPDSEWERRRTEYDRLCSLGDAVTREEHYLRTRLKSAIKNHDTDALYSSAVTTGTRTARTKRWPTVVDAGGSVPRDLWKAALKRQPGPRPTPASIAVLEEKLDGQGPSEDTVQDRIARIRMRERRRQARRQGKHIDRILSSESVEIHSSVPPSSSNDVASSESLPSIFQTDCAPWKIIAPHAGAYSSETITQPEAPSSHRCSLPDVSTGYTTCITMSKQAVTFPVIERDHTMNEVFPNWWSTIETYPGCDFSYDQKSSAAFDSHSLQQVQKAISDGSRTTDTKLFVTPGSYSYLSYPQTDQWERVTPGLLNNSEQTIQYTRQAEDYESFLQLSNVDAH